MVLNRQVMETPRLGNPFSVGGRYNSEWLEGATLIFFFGQDVVKSIYRRDISFFVYPFCFLPFTKLIVFL